MNLSYWFRRFLSLLAWPYGNPPISKHQQRREMFMTRMWEQSTDVGLDLCGLAVQYINALESTEELLTKRRWDTQEERCLETFCRDLRTRITLIDMATDPGVSGVAVTKDTLERWQWDDNLRFAMRLPNEQYGEILGSVNVLLAELANYPA